MSFCDGLFSKNCEVCYEYQAVGCTDISLTTDNLISGATYYIHILGQFDQYYTQEVEVGVGGTITLLEDDFPEGLFSKYQGKLYYYLSTESEPGTYDVAIEVNEVAYKCIIVELI